MGMTANVRLIAIGRSEAGQPFIVISDPAFVRWQAEGAPSCGATWEEETPFVCNVCEVQIEDGYELFDDVGNCYCEACYAVRDDDAAGEIWDFADAVSWF